MIPASGRTILTEFDQNVFVFLDSLVKIIICQHQHVLFFLDVARRQAEHADQDQSGYLHFRAASGGKFEVNLTKSPTTN